MLLLSITYAHPFGKNRIVFVDEEPFVVLMVEFDDKYHDIGLADSGQIKEIVVDHKRIYSIRGFEMFVSGMKQSKRIIGDYVEDFSVFGKNSAFIYIFS